MIRGVGGEPLERSHLIVRIGDHPVRLEQSADVSASTRTGWRIGVHKIISSTSRVLKQRLETAIHKAVQLCYNVVCDGDEHTGPLGFHFRTVAPIVYNRKITLGRYRPKSRLMSLSAWLHGPSGTVRRKLIFS